MPCLCHSMPSTDIAGSLRSGFSFLLVLLMHAARKIHANIDANESCEELNNWTPVQTSTINSNFPIGGKPYIPLDDMSYITSTKYARWTDKLNDWQELRYLFADDSNLTSSSIVWWVYQSSCNSWIRLALETTPPARVGYTLTTLCNTKIILFGGLDIASPKLFNDTWLFDGVSETWKKLNVQVQGKMYIKPRSGHRTVAVSQQMTNCVCKESLLVYGGHDTTLEREQQLWEMRCYANGNGQEAYHWIPKMNRSYTDSSDTQIPKLRSYRCAIAVSDIMYIWGGVEPFDGVWEYRLKSGQWKKHVNVQLGREFIRGCIYAICMPSQYQLLSKDGGRLFSIDHYGLCSYKLYLNGKIRFEHMTVQKIDLIGYYNVLEVSPLDIIDYNVVSSQRTGLQVYAVTYTGKNTFSLLQQAGEHEEFYLIRLNPPQIEPSILMYEKVLFDTHSLLYIESHLPSNLWCEVRQLDDRVSLWHFDFHHNVWFQLCPLFAPDAPQMQDQPFNDFFSQIQFRGQVYSASKNMSLLFRYSSFDSIAAKVTYKGHTNVRDRPENFIWVFNAQIRMWTLCLSILGQKKLPKPRRYFTLTELGNGSLLMFGGLTKDREIVNELWRVDVCDQSEYRPVRENCVRWTFLNGRNIYSIYPNARYQHASFFYNGSLFVFGGVQRGYTSSNTTFIIQPISSSVWCLSEFNADDTLLSDMWQLSIDSLVWKKIQLNQHIPISRIPINWKLAQTETKVVLVAGFYFDLTVCYNEEPGKYRSKLATPYLFNSTLVLDMMSLSLRKLADAPPGIPVGIQFMGKKLVLSTLKKYAVGYSSLTPACLAGYSSRKWGSESCIRCPRNYYSALGSLVCTKCPEGLTTDENEQKSVSDCVCSTDYCIHGKCIASAGRGKERSAICQCLVGFSGSRCQYPTYYLIGLSVLVVIILILLLTVFIKKMLKHRRAKRKVEDELTSVLRVWDIPFDEVTLHERVDGETPGSYGEVYRATYRDVTVAVKHMNEVMLSDLEVKKTFERELEVMRGIRHRNVIMFVGAGHMEREENGEKVSHPFLVVEFMSRGTLKKVLDSEEIFLSYRDKVSFALDAARGLQYLHSLSPPRIHRDMKSANLLVSHSWVVKVSDFGSARVVRREGERQPTNVERHRLDEDGDDSVPLLQSDLLLTRDTGTLLWRAPEIFAMKNYGTSADVYSYGIVLWEILCRQSPYNDHCFRWMKDVSREIQGGTRLTLPPSAPQLYLQLMTDCWQTNPDARPTFTDIVDRLVVMAGVLHDSQNEGIAETSSSLQT